MLQQAVQGSLAVLSPTPTPTTKLEARAHQAKVTKRQTVNTEIRQIQR